MRMRHIWAVAALLAALPPRAGADTGGRSGGPNIAALVSRLSAADFGARWQAHNELLHLGRKAEPALRQALKQKDLAKEARERIGSILDGLDAPGLGVVWRGRFGKKPPNGIRDGDVVTAIDGQRVGLWHVYWHWIGDGTALRKLTVWRKGRGAFQLSVLFQRKGFAAWPDFLELYRRHGHHGSWDQTAVKALRLVEHGKLPVRELETVWKAGCRDGLILSTHLQTMRYFRDPAGAEKLLKLSPEDLKGDYPGGQYRYGRFPVAAAEFHLSRNRADQARATLKQAVERAQRAGAWSALPYLRSWQAEMLMLGPPEEALAFWRRHTGELLTDPNYHLLVSMTHHMASEGDPNKALAFLKELPDWPVVERLRQFYAEQARAAAGSAPAQPRPHKVLVRWVPKIGPVLSPSKAWHMAGRLAITVPIPGGFEGEMRIAAETKGEDIEYGIVTMLLERQDRYDYVLLYLGQSGTIRHFDSDAPRDMVHWQPVGGAPFGWTRVSLELLPNSARSYVNGRAYRTTWRRSPAGGSARGLVRVKACTGEFRNLCFYVRSAVKVDNDALRKLLMDRHKAIRAGDLDRARRCHRDLLKRLSRVPEARSACTELGREMRMFEAIMSKEGLALCTQDILQLPSGIAHNHGEWSLRDGWLTGLRDKSCSCTNAYLVLPIPAPDAFELSGLCDMPDAGANAYTSLNWNSAVRLSNTTLVLFPRHGGAWLGGWYGEQTKVQKIDFSSPLPFGIRVRGDKVAVFLRFGSKPDIQKSGCKRSGGNLVVWGGRITRKAGVRLGKLVIRGLAKDTPLDSPMRLPKAPGKDKPTTGPAEQEW